MVWTQEREEACEGKAGCRGLHFSQCVACLTSLTTKIWMTFASSFFPDPSVRALPGLLTVRLVIRLLRDPNGPANVMSNFLWVKNS